MAGEQSGSSESPERFYRGTIVKLHRGSERGVIRSASGREVQFKFLHVTMLGPYRRFTDLREGLEVGYDVSWTSRGLRVSVIRIPS
jgi:hypothetical protein